MRLIFTSRKRHWQLTKGKFFSPLSARANANKYFDKTKTPFVPQWTDDWFIDYTSVITPPRLDSFNVDPGATLSHEGRTIRKVIGGGGGGGCGRSTKKYSRKGKLNEKNSCTPINPKKYSCYGLKKIHTRNLITKKIPAAQKFPTPQKRREELRKNMLVPSSI